MKPEAQVFSARAGRRFASALTVACAALVLGTATNAQDRDPTILYEDNGLTVRTHLQAGVNAVSEQNLFWGFADSFAPGSGFNADKNWLEFYIKPGVSFEKRLDAGQVFYGKLSAVASYTLGTDAYDYGDTGRTTIEEAYLGLRMQQAEGMGFDISLGPRELKLGTGMLIANGGSSGFERGALKFGPRKAWEMAAIGKRARAAAQPVIAGASAYRVIAASTDQVVVGTIADERVIMARTIDPLKAANDIALSLAAGGRLHPARIGVQIDSDACV